MGKAGALGWQLLMAPPPSEPAGDKLGSGFAFRRAAGPPESGRTFERQDAGKCSPRGVRSCQTVGLGAPQGDSEVPVWLKLCPFWAPWAFSGHPCPEPLTTCQVHKSCQQRKETEEGLEGPGGKEGSSYRDGNRELPSVPGQAPSCGLLGPRTRAPS